MNKLVAIVYPEITTASNVYAKFAQLQQEQLIDLQDVVVVTRDNKGKIKLHQSANITGEGAVVGSMWGLLIGMLFLSPLLGMAIGAGTGAIAGSIEDYGIDDNFIKKLSQKMKNNTSAIFVSATNAVADKVLPEISQFGGEIIQTSLSKDVEKKLQRALDKGAMKANYRAVAGA